MEFIENKITHKQEEQLLRWGRLGPILGSGLGLVPQCGFAAMAATLYSGGLITIGTLISIFLSTSDELIPLLLSYQLPIKLLLSILAIKFITGMLIGFITDIICRKVHKHKGIHIDELCEDHKCECANSILKSTLTHTLKIFIFIFIVSLLFELILEFVNMEVIIAFLSTNKILAHIICSIIGLVPNCASSVLLTEFYINNIITIAPFLTGLLVNSGIGIFTLFKTNKNLKENLKVLGITYGASIIVGLIIDLFFFDFL